jgi:hypothetical protein
MSPNNYKYKQLLIGGIILGSIIFLSNHLSSYAQELPKKTDDSSDETLDVTLPSPLFGGQEQGLYQESKSSVIQRETIEKQQVQEEEKEIEILEKQEDIGHEIQEGLEENDNSITVSEIIEEEEGNDQGIPLSYPFLELQ